MAAEKKQLSDLTVGGKVKSEGTEPGLIIEHTGVAHTEYTTGTYGGNSMGVVQIPGGTSGLLPLQVATPVIDSHAATMEYANRGRAIGAHTGITSIPGNAWTSMSWAHVRWHGSMSQIEKDWMNAIAIGDGMHPNFNILHAQKPCALVLTVNITGTPQSGCTALGAIMKVGNRDHSGEWAIATGFSEGAALTNGFGLTITSVVMLTTGQAVWLDLYSYGGGFTLFPDKTQWHAAFLGHVA